MGQKFSGVVIVGLGLLGSSVGLAVRRAGIAATIIGQDASPGHAEEAFRRGVVDRVAPTPDGILDGLPEDDPRPVLVVIAVPVCAVAGEIDKVIRAIREWNRRKETSGGSGSERLFLLTETASVQSGIKENIREEFPENAIFIGSHPIAGSEKSGPTAGFADLFQGKRVVTTLMSAGREPNRREPEALSLLEGFWRDLGAETVSLTAEDHDRILAKTSHLPQMVSDILASVPSMDEIPFTGTGWGGMTRLAAGNSEVWTDIFEMNRASVLAAIEEFEKWLSRWKSALENGSREQIQTLLKEAKKKRDALGS